MQKQSPTETATRKSAASPTHKKAASSNSNKTVAATKVTAKPQPALSKRSSTKDTKGTHREAANHVTDFYCDGVAVEVKKYPVTKRYRSAPLSTWAIYYYASDLERVTMIRQGVPATLLVDMGRAMNISNELLFTALALPRSTVVRKIQEKKSLSAEQSERVIGLERLVGQVAEMVKQSGNAEGFDAGRWVGEWLQRPLPALAGKRPAEFMDTMAGQDLVSKLLAQSQSGAYA